MIPKPIRATYPCQQAAFPVASAFVIWLLGLKTGLLAWLKSRERCERFRPAAELCLLAGLVWIATQTVMAFILPGGGSASSVTVAPGWIPGDPPNAPVGQAKGIFPGRVTWIRDTNATPWRGPGYGYWWHDTNINQTALDRMVSRSLRSLSGATNDAQAWDRLFRHFNTNHARGDYGYRTNEAIAIKVNLNNSYSGYTDADNNIDASPQSVLALLRQLVNQAGVPQGKITVYDATRTVFPTGSTTRGTPNSPACIGWTARGSTAARRPTGCAGPSAIRANFDRVRNPPAALRGERHVPDQFRAAQRPRDFRHHAVREEPFWFDRKPGQ